MKLFSIVLVATLFCAVAVSATPSSTIDDESTLSIVDDIAKKLEKLKEQIKCAINVIGKVASGSDLERKYIEFKAAVNAVLTKDLKNCVHAKGVKAKLRCFVGASKKLAQLFSDFTKEVVVTNKEMAEQIIIEITNQCTMDFDLFELDGNSFETIESSMADYDEISTEDEIEKNKKQVQCVIKSIEDAIKDSKIVKVTSQWEVTQKFLEVLFNRINACKNIEDKIEQDECIVSEFPNFQKVIDMFVVDLLKKDYPELYNRVQQNIKQNNCN